MAESVELALDFDTPLGPIRGRVNIEKEPKGLADLVPTAVQLTEVLVQRAAQKEEAQGRKISCQAGCGACCRQMVPLSAPEAFYLMDMLDAFPPRKRSEVLARFEAAVRELESRQMAEPFLEPEYSDEVALSIAKAYFSLQIPCPFLIDESCSIHRFRPVACREYNVTSPAQNCANPFGTGIERVRLPMPLSAPLARLTAKLTGSAPRLIPLTLFPRWVAQNAALRTRQWDGLELFVGFLQELGLKDGLPGLAPPPPPSAPEAH